MEELYYDSTLTGEELDEALRSLKANVARSETAAKAAESWAQGGTKTRDGEDTDNAEYWAKQAKASQTAAAGSAGTAKDSETAAAGSKDAAAKSAAAAQASQDAAKASQTAAAGSADAAKSSAAGAKESETNAGASKNSAQTAAGRADAAADSAAGDAERAEAAAKLAQSIAQGQKGYYATPEALKAAFPSGEDGDWAIVGSTDTIWIWDADDGQWEDSGNKTDLSNYYTRPETDEKLAGKLGKTETAAAAGRLDGILPIANGGTGLSAGMSNTWINITHQCQYHSRISPDAYTWIFYNPFLQMLSGFLYVSPGEAIPNNTILCTFPATVPYSAPRIFASLGESIADAGNIVGLSIHNNALIYCSSTGAGLTGAGHFPFTIPIVSG